MKLNRLIIYLIILCLFFEAQVFSVNILGARVRSSQFIACLGILFLLAGIFCLRFKLKKTQADLLLWIYQGINFLAMIKSSQPWRLLSFFFLSFGRFFKKDSCTLPMNNYGQWISGSWP